MPIFRCDLIDNAVWLWVRALIEEPEAFSEGLRGLQEETRQKNRALFDRLELTESQLAETEKQENKLLDLYLSGDLLKEVMLERRNRLAKLTPDLKKEQADLSVFLQQLTFSIVEIASIEDFFIKNPRRTGYG